MSRRPPACTRGPKAPVISSREHDTCYSGSDSYAPVRPHQHRRTRVRQETTGGDESLARVTPEMVEDWLRHARLRAANLFYLADDPSPGHRERALREMTQALREALEEVRVVADELRRAGATDGLIRRREGTADRNPNSPPPER